MMAEQAATGLSAGERDWVRARLRARLGGAAVDTLATTDLWEHEINTLLDEVLAQRSAPDPAPAHRHTRQDPRQRVVITGMGIVSPGGRSLTQYWDSLSHGRSGISFVEAFDISPYACRFAGEVKQWDPTPWIVEKEAKRMSRATQFIVSAARQAMADSGFLVPEGGSDQLGVLIGSGTTALPETEAEIKTLITRGGRRVSPFFVTTVLPNMPAGQLGLQFGARGWNAAITSACSASSTAIGEGAEIIRRGVVTAMIVGGTEAPLSEIGTAAFCNMRTLSTRNDDPTGACRPWDATRDGMVGGEGAGVMIIERLDHALARGAHIYAEVLGHGGSCDAFHMAAPDPTGNGAALAVRRALESAGITPTDVQYINAHGTGTDLNDPMETRAIKQVFGDHAYRLAISSTKSMMGHPLAACGAVEGVATVLALQHQVIPPTINLHHPDPECDLDYTPLEARPADLRIAVSENFGLGGQNAAVVFRRWNGE